MEISARVNAIRGIHLFPGLPEEKLIAIAEKFNPVEFKAGDTIFAQDAPGDSFYVIVRGRVDIIHKGKKESKKLATFSQGDYFGETALVRKKRRNATAKAQTDATLLKMESGDFDELRKSIPRLAMIFDIVAEVREELQHMSFEWIEEGEVVYYLAKKHLLELFIVLVRPIIILLTPGLILFLMGMGSQNRLGDYLWAIGIPLLVMGVLWSIWIYLDWGNDYYAVTNRRVLMKQKVIGIHESRSEALLSSIRAVSVETGFWERWLDSGSIIITTFTGKFRMDDIDHPRQVASIIEEYWQRTKQVMMGEQKESLRKVIRDRINPPPPPPPKPATAPVPAAQSRKPLFQFKLKGMFALRTEVAGSITYHKHWFILLRDSWVRILLMLATIITAIAAPFITTTWASVILVCAVIFIVIFGYWYIWDYGDWSNDLYLVTPDKVIDVYRVPFGKEERKDAPLVNIQTIEYTRNGIIGTLFNFGNVKVSMGGTIVFDFTDVHDPPGVQNDIARRLTAAIKKKADTDAQAERSQMLNFIADYHSIADELRRLDPPKM